tara:strand:- start:412 stop:534 length:123 start_codon:yes stop_codon:yes gene_type:complete
LGDWEGGGALEKTALPLLCVEQTLGIETAGTASVFKDKLP